MGRRIGWFSCGAASAIACRLAEPDLIAYCDTGAEHEDNQRFLHDCESAFGWSVQRLRSEKYVDTWAVWEGERYISGVRGAPCTRHLKVYPRLAMQRPDDVHIFGYTADSRDAKRAEALNEHYPELSTEFPLIERGITKAGCRALLSGFGIAEPITYAMGFPNANCIPCVKSQSPAYWALVRKHFPTKFERMVELSRRLGVRLIRLNGERAFIDEIPLDHLTTEPDAPLFDFLCQIAEQDLHGA